MENIIQKIQKLIEKSQSTDSIEESEAFMLKAQQLLKDYNISEFDLNKNIANVSDGVSEICLPYKEKFEEELLFAVGENNFCFCINSSFGGKSGCGEVIIIGKINNISVVAYLYSYFRSKILDLSIKSYENHVIQTKRTLAQNGLPFTENIKKSLDKSYIKDYLIGAVHGIRSKMQKQLETTKNQCRDLILFNDKAVEKYAKEHHKFSMKKTKETNKSGAYFQGFEDGKGIKVNHGINQSNGNSKLLKMLQ